MTGWMFYSIEVGLCVAAVAWSAEAFVRLFRRPSRFIWLGAALCGVGLSVRAAMIRNELHGSLPSSGVASLDILQVGIVSAQRQVTAIRPEYVVVFWASLSMFVAIAFAGTQWRMRRASRAWPVTHLDGHRVLVAPSTGPLVLGLIRPEVVVPRWVLTRPRSELRVILNHEVEHVNAGDQNLLAIGCLIAALMPWNPASWIVLARLRLAVEIDCDARVLRGGVSPVSYSSLLVDVAEGPTPFLLGTMGLASRSSHLRSRILAMQSDRSNHSLMRGATAAVVGLISFLAACEARVPTAADIARMDGVAVQRAAPLMGVAADSSVTWLVDGVRSTAAAAKQIPADSIERVDVTKGDGQGQISLTTKRAHATATSMHAAAGDVARAEHVTSNPPSSAEAKAFVSGTGQSPLVIIDGAQSTTTALANLSRDRIESVEIVKGVAATARYGESGINGVILVTTKPGGER